MFKDKLFGVIGRQKSGHSDGAPSGKRRSRKQQRHSNQDFLETYNLIWKPGPNIRYQNPDGWIC